MSPIRQSTLKAQNRVLRTQLFPDVEEKELWERTSKKGFATIPRALPTVMVLMDELSPKKPISAAYLALWCRAWDDPLIKIGGKMAEIAMEAGFTGQRPTNTLSARFAILKQLGFVRFEEGPGGPYSYALILNPYLVLKKHKKNIRKFNWNALLERMHDIGADDFTPPLPTPPPVDFSALLTQAPKAPKPPLPKPPAPPPPVTTAVPIKKKKK